MLLEGDFKEGDTIRVDADEEGLTFRRREGGQDKRLGGGPGPVARLPAVKPCPPPKPPANPYKCRGDPLGRPFHVSTVLYCKGLGAGDVGGKRALSPLRTSLKRLRPEPEGFYKSLITSGSSFPAEPLRKWSVRLW